MCGGRGDFGKRVKPLCSAVETILNNRLAEINESIISGNTSVLIGCKTGENRWPRAVHTCDRSSGTRDGPSSGENLDSAFSKGVF